MDILVLTPQLPFPAYQGTSLRNYHILRGLAEENEITLLSFAEGDGLGALPAELTALGEEIISVPAPPARETWRRLWQLASSRQPDMALRLLSAEYEAALLRLLERRVFDIVQIEGLEMAWTIPLIRRAAPRAALVFDAHNAETLLQSRSADADRQRLQRWPAVAYSRLQSSRLAAYEAWVCSAVDQVTAVSEADSAALRALLQPLPGEGRVTFPSCPTVSTSALTRRRASLLSRCRRNSVLTSSSAARWITGPMLTRYCGLPRRSGR